MTSYERKLCGKNDPTFSGLTLFTDRETGELAAVGLPGSNSLYDPSRLAKQIDHMQSYDESQISPHKGEFTEHLVRSLAQSSFLENRYDTKTHEGSNAAMLAVHQALRKTGAELNINNPVVKAIRAQEYATVAPKPAYPPKGQPLRQRPRVRP